MPELEQVTKTLEVVSQTITFLNEREYLGQEVQKAHDCFLWLSGLRAGLEKRKDEIESEMAAPKFVSMEEVRGG